MKTIARSILIGCLALRCAVAADAPADKEEAHANPPPTIELKNKSSFVMDESGRNPFWPIGWRPAAKAAANPDRVGPDISPGSFLVSSIVLDAKAKFAIVNGKTMSEGQVFGLQLGNQTYQITVKEIQDGQIVLLRRDQEIVVPLRRK